MASGTYSKRVSSRTYGDIYRSSRVIKQGRTMSLAEGSEGILTRSTDGVFSYAKVFEAMDTAMENLPDLGKLLGANETQVLQLDTLKQMKGYLGTVRQNNTDVSVMGGIHGEIDNFIYDTDEGTLGALAELGLSAMGVNAKGCGKLIVRVAKVEHELERLPIKMLFGHMERSLQHKLGWLVGKDEIHTLFGTIASEDETGVKFKDFVGIAQVAFTGVKGDHTGGKGGDNQLARIVNTVAINPEILTSLRSLIPA